jgi:phosphoenolpyruvate carboxylase
LGTLLDDVLKSEVGAELFNKVERIRSLAQCAAQLANKHDAVSSQALVTHVIPQRQQRVESMPQ